MSRQPLILAIDPGTLQSGWVLFDGTEVKDSGVHPNHDVLRWVKEGQGADVMAVEMMKARGMPTSNDEFKTLVWVGRFVQGWRDPEAVRLVYRQDVKMLLCNSMRAKDSNIRAALIDLFPATGGGATPQIGTKGKRGPLYGVSTHAWPALGVAVTALRQLGSLKVTTQGPLFDQQQQLPKGKRDFFLDGVVERA